MITLTLLLSLWAVIAAYRSYPEVNYNTPLRLHEGISKVFAEELANCYLVERSV